MSNDYINKLSGEQIEHPNRESQNVVVPITLAHRFTAISFESGGRVLDIFAKQEMRGQNNG